MTREQFIAHVEATQSEFRRFLVALCCGDSSLADDIAQETLIKAYLSCDSITHLKAWIYRVGYTTFIDHKRAIRLFDNIDTAHTISAPDNADGAFCYEELYAALQQLPPRERASVLLHYLEGNSIKEIAAIQGASPDAVKQHLSRGRNHLRQLLIDK